MKDNILSRIKRNLIYHAWVRPFSIYNKNKLSNFNQHVYIFAMGRGGSTILLESIHKGLSKATKIWEPLAGGCIKIKELKKWNFTIQPIIPEQNKTPELLSTFESLLKGGYLNLSMTYVNERLTSMPLNKHLIFKFCRGNNLLPWLVRNFDLKPILLIRSPYSTINSQINHGAYSTLKDDPSFTISDETPFIEEYERYKPVFQNCKSIEEHLAIKWALNMQIVNHPLHNIKWLTIFYEDLIQKPKIEFNRIKDHLNLPIDTKKCILNLGSLSSTGSSGKKKKLSREGVKKIDAILDKMNLLEYTKEHFETPS